MLRYRIYSFQYGFAATVLRAMAAYCREAQNQERSHRAAWIRYRVYSLRHGLGATVLRAVAKHLRETPVRHAGHHAA